MRRRRWIRLASVLFLLPLFGGDRTSAAPETTPPARPSALHLRVLARAHEPYVFLADGKAQGFEVDLLGVACSMLGWTYDLQWDPGDTVAERLTRGDADLGAGGLYVTSERSRELLLTRPHLRSGLVALTSSDPPVTSIKDLAGKRVGVRRGAASEALLRDMDARLGLRLAIATFTANEEGFSALRNGQMDVFLTDYQNSLFVIRQRYPGQITMPRGMLGPRLLSRDDIAFAFRPGLERERDAFDEALETMRRSGMMAHFRAKWLVEGQPIETAKAVKLGAIALAVLLLGAAAFYLWRRGRRRLAALEEAERITRSLIDVSPLAVLLHRSGNILYMNQQGLSMFGLESPEAATVLSTPDLVAPEERERVRSIAVGRLTGKDVPDKYRTVGLRRNGERFALEVWAASATLADGPAALVYLRDVEQQERVMRALEKSERDYRELFEKASDAILVLATGSGAVMDANAQACRVYGYSREELLRLTLFDLVSQPAVGRSRMEEILARGHLPQFETTHVRKDGRLLHLEVNASLVEYGGRLAVLSMHRDITARKAAEEALVESERRLRLLMDSANDAIFIADAETGALVDANRRAQELIGRTLEEIRKMNQWDLHPPEERERYQRIFQQHVVSGRAIADYLEVVRRDGTKIPVEVSSSIVEVGGRRLNQGFFRDVSKRRAAEAALKESEERFRTLAETTSAAIMIYQDEAFQYVNPASLSMTGFTWEEVRGMKFWELVHPDHRELVRQRGLARQRGEEVPNRYEFKILTKDGRVRWMDFSAGLVQWKGRPAGVVTAFDVTERKSQEEALRTSEQRLRLILEGVQEIVYTVQFDAGFINSTCTFASDQVGPLLGLTPQEFYEDPGLFQKILHPEDEAAAREAVAKMLATGEPASRTYRLFSKTAGGYLWFEDRMAPLRDKSGAISGFQGTARDVTEQRRAAEEIRQAAREQEALLRSSQAMAGFLDLKPAAQAICEAAVEAFNLRMAWIGLVVPEGTEVRVLASAGHDEGYTDDVRVRWDLSPRAMGPLGRAIKAREPVVMSVADPDFAPWRDAAVARGYKSVCGLPLLHEDTVRGGLALYGAEADTFTPLRLPVLEIFARQATMTIVNAALYEEAKQTIEELGALNEELTSAQEQQRLQLEALEESQRRLEESEARFRQLAETAEAAIFIARDFRYLYVNPYMERATGYTRQELLAMESWAIVHPEDREKVRDPAFAQRDLAKGPVHYEIRILRKDGEVRWVEISAGLLDFGGQRSVIGTAYDITGRKQALDALEASQRQFQDLAENTADWVWEVGPDLRYTYSSPRSTDLLGFEPEEILGRSPLEFMPPPEAERIRRILAEPEVRRQGFRGLLNRNVRKDGREVVLETSATAILDDLGTFRGFRGIDRDVTDRLKAEEALRESEQRFKQIVEHSTNLFYTHTADHVLTYVSPRSRHFLGCDPEEARTRWTEFLTDNPENRKGIELTQRAIDTGERQPPYQLELRTKDGRTVWVEVNETPIVEEGRTVAIVGALTDITARMEAQEVLLESERRYRAIVEKARGVVLKFDRNLRITYWNEFATEVFGYARKEILGRSLIGTIVPETESTGRNLKALLSAVAEDPDRFASNINQNLTKDGRLLWMAWTNRPILDARGDLVEVLSLATDITALKESEILLRETVEGLRRLRALSPMPLVAVDPDARVLEWNAAATRLTGWTREEVLGETCPLLASSGLPGFRAFLAEAESQGEAIKIVPGCRLKGGGRMDLKIIAVPLRGPAGRVASLQVILLKAEDGRAGG